MPVYNEQAYIAQSLNSILGMKDFKKPMEIIVIDDASTDMTPSILSSMAKNNKNIKVIRNEERLGAAICRNTGNKLVQTDVTIVCDADISEEFRLRWVLKTFEEKDIDLFYSGYYVVDSKDVTRRQYIPIYGWDFKSKCTLSHPTLAYKTAAILEHPYHEVSKETDLFEFMILDMHKAGKKIDGVHVPLVTKIEGNRRRDRAESDKLKKEMYAKYEIQI